MEGEEFLTGKAIKIKLLELNKTQLDLLDELKKYGYRLMKQTLSGYITAAYTAHRLMQYLGLWEKF